MGDSHIGNKGNANGAKPKYFRSTRVSDEILKFAVYVEKFDTKHHDTANNKIKVSPHDWDNIRAGIFKAYLESLNLQNKLKDDCEKRLYNGKIAIFYTKSNLAQNFVIQTINEKLKLPGIKARPPWTEARPNFHAFFPSVMNNFKPEHVLKEAIAMHTEIDCDPVVRSSKDAGTKGKTVAFNLPEDKLAQLQLWALDNNAKYFSLFTERLRFWIHPNGSPSSTPQSAKTPATSSEGNPLALLPQVAPKAVSSEAAPTATSPPSPTTSPTHKAAPAPAVTSPEVTPRASSTSAANPTAVAPSAASPMAVNQSEATPPSTSLRAAPTATLAVAAPTATPPPALPEAKPSRPTAQLAHVLSDANPANPLAAASQAAAPMAVNPSVTASTTVASTMATSTAMVKSANPSNSVTTSSAAAKVTTTTISPEIVISSELAATPSLTQEIIGPSHGPMWATVPLRGLNPSVASTLQSAHSPTLATSSKVAPVASLLPKIASTANSSPINASSPTSAAPTVTSFETTATATSPEVAHTVTPKSDTAARSSTGTTLEAPLEGASKETSTELASTPQSAKTPTPATPFEVTSVALNIGLSTPTRAVLTATPKSGRALRPSLALVKATKKKPKKATKLVKDDSIAFSRPRRACTLSSRRSQKLIPEYFCNN